MLVSFSSVTHQTALTQALVPNMQGDLIAVGSVDTLVDVAKAMARCFFDRSYFPFRHEIVVSPRSPKLFPKS